LCELAAQRGRVDVVDERALAADLDDRQPLAIALLELGVAGDVDLAKLDALADERRTRPLAQVAALGAIENDVAAYGYMPRVVVASATRCTATPYAARRIDVFLPSQRDQVSLNERVMMSFSFALTSSSFQKYSWRPWTHSK
jgi:hypothetical protein